MVFLWKNGIFSSSQSSASTADCFEGFSKLPKNTQSFFTKKNSLIISHQRFTYFVHAALDVRIWQVRVLLCQLSDFFEVSQAFCESHRSRLKITNLTNRIYKKYSLENWLQMYDLFNILYYLKLQIVQRNRQFRVQDPEL